MRILINVLDDEQIILEWLQDLFPSDTYDLKLFNDARQFIQAFSTNTDLIITDVRVPKFDLIKTLHDFKQINRGVFIIVISGYLSVEFLLPLFPLGVNYVIAKDTIGTSWLEEVKNAVEELIPRMEHRDRLLTGV